MHDQLIKQAFKLPDQFGSSVATPQARAHSDMLLHKSARIYGQECEELMYHATSIPSGDARQGNIDCSRTRSWGSVAKMAMIMIIAALIGNHTVEAAGDSLEPRRNSLV